MDSDPLGSVGRSASAYGALRDRTTQAEYNKAEDSIAEMIKVKSLDEHVKCQPQAARLFERGPEKALDTVYKLSAAHTDRAPSTNEFGHLFLQRVLYRINRLKLFWFDDLRNYDNERSSYLHKVRNRIEGAWQTWELARFDVAAFGREDASDALQRRAACDVSPASSSCGLYFRHEITEVGYRRLLAIASLDGMVEASQLSRTLGGVSNNIQSMMTRLLVEEYGGGRLNRKHSTFFKAMLTELNMCTEPEAYLDVVPWEVLAAINHSFLLSERKRFYLRYVGGLLYTEISVPAAFGNYRAAAERLTMSEAARSYWELHIREDKRHGQWMLHDVALPLAAMYPGDAWELVFGYDQQKFISDRAAVSVAQSVRAAEGEESANQSAA